MELDFEIEEEKLTPVHPGIDVVNGVAYIGYWKNCVFRTARGAEKRMPALFLIREDGEEILYHPDVLAEYGLRPMYTPVEMDNWWYGKIVDVNPKSLYEEVEENYRTYMDMKDEEYAVISLWAIGTYFHVLFKSYPYLYIGGAKRSGKTRCLLLTKQIAYNAIMSHDMSTATLYRLVQNARCTLLMDEVERLSDPKSMKEFRCLLLGGYKKGSFVFRTEKSTKERLIPTRFQIYGPKALANISGLDDVLEDRTITIILERSLRKDIIDTEFDEDDPYWLDLRTRLASLFMKYHREVEKLYKGVLKAFSRLKDFSDIPEQFRDELARYRDQVSGRNREVWAPIMTMALFFEIHGVEGLMDRIMKVATIDIRERLVEDTMTPEGALAEVIVEIYDPNEVWYPISAIAEKLKEKLEVRKMDARTAGRLMRRLGFRSKRRRSGGVEYFIARNDVLRIIRKYLEINITQEEFEKLLNENNLTSILNKEDQVFEIQEQPQQAPTADSNKQPTVKDIGVRVNEFLKNFGPATKSILRAFLAGAGVDPLKCDEVIETMVNNGVIRMDKDGYYHPIV